MVVKKFDSWRQSFLSTPLLHSCREADNGEEKSVRVEVLKHSLDGLPVDPEGHAGRSQIQAAADHVVGVQQVLVNGGHGPGDSAWTETQRDDMDGGQ